MTILPAGDGDVSDNGGALFYDQLRPAPFKSQVYVDYADHNYFNREWINDERGRLPPDILDRSTHERILSGYSVAFYRSFLLDHPLTGYLTYRQHPPGFDPGLVHLSFEWKEQMMVDDHEQANGIVKNTFNQPTSQSASLTAEEYELWRGAANGYRTGSFWGKSNGMVVEGPGVFRSGLAAALDLAPNSGCEIWLRVAEVSDGGRNPPAGVAFDLGVEDGSGTLAWTSSDDIGPVPRPFDRAFTSTKSMMTTLRFPPRCLRAEDPKFDVSDIRAILIRTDGHARNGIAFDIMQVVREP